MNTTVSPHSSSRPAASPAAASRPPGVLHALREALATEAEGAPAAPAPVDSGSGRPPAGGFSAAQLAALSAPLDRSHVCSREQGRGKVSYIQSWVVISEANRIFGFDGWQRQTTLCRCVSQAERRIGQQQKPGWGVTYIARVRITVNAGGVVPLIREGTGAGHGIDADLGQAHESAIKEAETDAMKRALMTFGNPFGLALYDKSQRQVTPFGSPAGSAQACGSERQASSAIRRPVPAASHPAATARPQASGASGPLDPATIQGLQERIRALVPPALAAFTRAFRSAFQVPESVSTIAGLITEQRHRLWIEQYLGQGEGHPQS